MSINRNQVLAETENQLELWTDGSGQAGESGFFRPIHYIGSKLRVVDAVRGALDEADRSCGRVCDLFSGSGTVSLALASYRKVTSVDIQEYSRTICSALLRPNFVPDERVEEFLQTAAQRSSQLKAAIGPLIDFETASFGEAANGRQEPLCSLVEDGSIVGCELSRHTISDKDLAEAIENSIDNLKALGLHRSADSLVTRYYGGVYFSFPQAADLDSLLSAASESPAEIRDTILAAVLSTASATVNTIGKQFAQPIRPRDSDGKPKRHLVKKILKDRGLDANSTFRDWIRAYGSIDVKYPDNTVIRSDYSSMLDTYDGDLSVVYADPPYTRDHYSRFYHVLETMCLRDNPEVSKVKIQGEDRISRGLYRANRHQSPFCIRSKAPAAFRKLFSAVGGRRIPLVLSYSPDTGYDGARPRVMTLDSIRRIALEFFHSVEVGQAGSISHSKLNNSNMILGESADAEVIFVCKP